MILLFTRSNNISSKLIRLVTWSSWSHVAMVNSSDIESITEYTEVIDSTFLHGGVQSRPLHQVLHNMDKWAYVEVPVANEKLAWSAARSQLGKPYDVTALIGIFFHRNWQNPTRWFCNELVEWCLEFGGSGRFIEDISTLSPKHSWMLKTPKPPVYRNKNEHTV